MENPEARTVMAALGPATITFSLLGERLGEKLANRWMITQLASERDSGRLSLTLGAMKQEISKSLRKTPKIPRL